MSITSFGHDVFISYAHVDNETVDEERGWVEHFHAQLDLLVRRKKGDMEGEVDLWRDKRLELSQRFDAVLEKAVEASAVMVALLSPSSLKGYCQQEREWFHRKAAAEPAGVTVEDSLRIIPVLLYNLPPEQWPEECQGVSAFRFYQAEDDDLGDPLDPNSTDFLTRLKALAAELVKVLRRVDRKSGGGQEDAERTSGEQSDPSVAAFTVFLARPSYGLEPNCRQLKDELERDGVTVISDIPPPYGEAEHAEAVRAAVNDVDLSIHLLGTTPGEPISTDQPDKTFPVEQAAIAMEHARSQLILLPDEVDIDAIPEGHYAEFIRSVAGKDREANELEMILSGRRQMVDAVRQKRARLEQAARDLKAAVGGEVGTAFIDLHMKDVPQAVQLLEYLDGRGVRPLVCPSSDTAPTMKPFEENIKKADLFIVVFGQIGRDWVDGRLEEALKLIVTNRLPYRPAVYLAPEHGRSEEAFAGVYEVLDDVGKVDRLLEQVRKARQ